MRKSSDTIHTWHSETPAFFCAASNSYACSGIASDLVRTLLHQISLGRYWAMSRIRES